MVATYSVGQLLWLRACAALLVLLPMIWRQRAEFIRTRTAVAAIASGDCSRRSKSRRSFSPPSICRSPTSSPITWPGRFSSPRCRASCWASSVGWRRWTRDPDRLLRRADRAASVGADRELAGDDRARRQPVVCVADADHALAARDAGYRAGVVAIRRHVPARRADVADRLGDADARAASACSPRRASFRWRAAMRQPLAETGAGQRRGAVSIFDDRLGGDLRLCRVRRRAVDRRPSSARRSSSAPGSTSSCASSSSGARKRWSIRRRDDIFRCRPGPVRDCATGAGNYTTAFVALRSSDRFAPCIRDDDAALPRASTVASNCPSSSATTRRCATGGSNRPGSRIPAPRSGAARRRSTGSRISPECCATPGWRRGRRRSGARHRTPRRRNRSPRARPRCQSPGPNARRRANSRVPARPASRQSMPTMPIGE